MAPRERGIVLTTEEKLKNAEAALVHIMGDVVATTQKWIELSSAVQAGEITDIKALEEEYSKFLLLTVLLSSEILQSQYGDVVSAEATRNTSIRTLPF
jgi:type II secretory pathway component PulL